jgi:hypothetical protein
MLEMNGYEVDAYQDPLLALSREDNPNWSGACDELAKLAKPTLVITGTDDNKHKCFAISTNDLPVTWISIMSY